MDLFISTLLLKYPFQIVHINLLQDDAYVGRVIDRTVLW